MLVRWGSIDRRVVRWSRCDSALGCDAENSVTMMQNCAIALLEMARVPGALPAACLEHMPA